MLMQTKFRKSTYGDFLIKGNIDFVGVLPQNLQRIIIYDFQNPFSNEHEISKISDYCASLCSNRSFNLARVISVDPFQSRSYLTRIHKSLKIDGFKFMQLDSDRESYILAVQDKSATDKTILSYFIDAFDSYFMPGDFLILSNSAELIMKSNQSIKKSMDRTKSFIDFNALLDRNVDFVAAYGSEDYGGAYLITSIPNLSLPST